MHTLAIIGAGSNLGARGAILDAARLHLEARGMRTERRSHRYQSAAMVQPGQQPGPDFLNEAWRVRSARGPERLLDVLHETERAFGRTRTARWADRTLDLDVLWMDKAHRSRRLEVPHPGLATRSFAIAPLLDVHPQLAKGLLRGLRQPPQRVSRVSWRHTQCGIAASGPGPEALSAALNGVLSEPVPALLVRRITAGPDTLEQRIAAIGMRIRVIAVLATDHAQPEPWRIALAGTPGRPRALGSLNLEADPKQPMRLWVLAS